MALNPVAYTENVVRSFLRYQLTAYPFADTGLHRQMRELLSLDRTRRSPPLKGYVLAGSYPIVAGGPPVASNQPAGLLVVIKQGGRNLPPCPYVSLLLRQPAVFFDSYLGSSQVVAKHMVRHLACPNRNYYRATGTSLCHLDV